METLLAFTPGVLALLQGDEYMEPRNMAAHPVALALQEAVGTLVGDLWTRQGPDFGKFRALRSLLALREEWGLMEPHAMTRLMVREEALVAMALQEAPLVLLLRTAATEETWVLGRAETQGGRGAADDLRRGYGVVAGVQLGR